MQTSSRASAHISQMYGYNILSRDATPVRTPSEMRQVIERTKQKAGSIIETVDLVIQNRAHMVNLVKVLNTIPSKPSVDINKITVQLRDITDRELSVLSELNPSCIHLNNATLERILTHTCGHLVIENCPNLTEVGSNTLSILIDKTPKLSLLLVPYASHVYLYGTPGIKTIDAVKATFLSSGLQAGGSASLPELKRLVIPSYKGTVDVATTPKLEYLEASAARRITNVPYYKALPEIAGRYQKLPDQATTLLIVCIIALDVFATLSPIMFFHELSKAADEDKGKYYALAPFNILFAMTAYVVSKFVWEKMAVPAITDIELDSWHPIWWGRSLVKF